MKKFSETIKHFLAIRQYGYYRLCWIPRANIYSVIEFFDDELHKIDPKKVELLII